MADGRQQLASRAGIQAKEFRLTSPPRLRDHLSGKSLTEAASSFDTALAEWVRNAQAAITEHVAQVDAKIPPSKP